MEKLNNQPNEQKHSTYKCLIEIREDIQYGTDITRLVFSKILTLDTP